MNDAILTYCATWRTLVEIATRVPTAEHDTGMTVAKLLASGQLERKERRPRGGGTVFEYRTVA